MLAALPLRSPLHDARRLSLDQSNAISVFRSSNRSVEVATGNRIPSEQRLFRKNNLISLPSDSEMWKNHKNRMAAHGEGHLRAENRFGSAPMLNCVTEWKPEDGSFSRKNVHRKVGRVSPFVAPREEEEDEEKESEENATDQVESNLSAELEQQAYLVLGINNQARRPFKRKICTPFNGRLTMPPEHFKVSVVQ